MTIIKPLTYEVSDDPTKELSIFFGGDTLLGDAAQKILNRNGYIYPFKYLDQIYKSADVRTLNLEAPISQIAKKIEAEKDYIYNMSPLVLDVFKQKAFNIFFLANNHSTDYGHDGLLETIMYLKKNSMIPLGAGKNKKEARKALVIRKGNIKVAILNYMSFRKRYQEKYQHFASNVHSGIAALSKKEVSNDIKALRKIGINTIVVSIHWGKNYEPVSEEQLLQAKMIVKAGADIIVGHGSHQYQTISMLDGVPVFFSVGNFIFNTPGRSPLTYGFPITLHVNESGLTRAEIWPIHTNNKIIKFQPRHLSGEEAYEAIHELYTNSELNGLKKEIDINKGVLFF
ncbi:CapA family protein [Neobacillus niacini]|uniref:CapA family protein n=1 Tax=Neobacillus niacini TaxID=86668 RepID=UPI0005F04062|nr:CapA family protein [Neobacillus niacini]